MKLVTADEMRALEKQAVEAGISLEELRQAAGLAVAQEAWLMLGVVAGRRVLVLVGPGNNGSDGLVAARHLAEWDADVVVYLLTARSDTDEDVGAVRELGVPVFVAADDAKSAQLDEAMARAELVIDALLGIGRSRPITGTLAIVLEKLHNTRAGAAPPQVVAVDMPTGVDADTGHADPLAVTADMTVTFGLAKVGLYMLPGSQHAGRVQVIDIGLPKEEERELTVELLGSAWVRDRLPARPLDGNKGTFGRVLLVAGSDQYVGAPRLVAEACYRAGAGIVSIACSARVQAVVAPALPEATYVLRDARPNAVTEALTTSDALVIGPGLGQSAEVRELVGETLRAAPVEVHGCVVDADALNALARTTGWSDAVRARCVLTPHPGEMARLLGTETEAVQTDRLRAARTAARTWGQVVVLKGAHTIIAATGGRVAISPYANALLATAGTGDVLAGIIGGLLAQGVAPFEAAACGVYVHGMAAEELREEFGDRGMLASELLPLIPRMMRIIREGRPMRTPSPFSSAAFASAPAAGFRARPEL